jgi:hypothetical protein
MPAILGSYKDGSDIYKDKTGLYIVQWDPKKETEYKKRLKTLKRFLDKSPRKTRKARTTRK